jgi:hypothetical protein
MKTMSATDFKKKFSQLFKQMIDGETTAVTDDKTKEIIGYFTLELSARPKRQLGILEGKVTVTFGPDWEMTEEEFLGSDDGKI